MSVCYQYSVFSSDKHNVNLSQSINHLNLKLDGDDDDDVPCVVCSIFPYF